MRFLKYKWHLSRNEYSADPIKLLIYLSFEFVFERSEVTKFSILVEEVKMCGIRGTASIFTNSYLSNRDQYVVCGDYKSDVFTCC